jgi:glycosyltransferase involved in cell wall biosynthesis
MHSDQVQKGRFLVVVIGMHRSGTSLLGSLAQSLGVDMGEDLYPADEHNPAGYFEDRLCVEIQDRMLAVLGQQPWHGEKGMMPFPPLWWRQPEMLPLVAELEQWLDSRLLAATTICGVKDPRTTRFLPLWNELLKKRGLQPRYLLAVRNPAEVVASIRARDGAQPEHVYRTWLRFNMEALLHAGADLAGVFSYARWFDDGERQLLQLAQALGVHTDMQQCQYILHTRLRADLHRQTAIGLKAPDWAQTFFERLDELGENFAAKDIAQLATEAEYADALLQRGEMPRWTGALHVVVTSADATRASIRLAKDLSDAGHRVVLAPDDLCEVSDLPAAIALVHREIAGPELGGWLHTRRAYQVWLWLRSRAFAQVHIEGGSGLAAHVLDSRRQGWTDFHGDVHVHYFALPSWLEPDGLVHLHDVLEAEALCLERRIAHDVSHATHVPPALSALLSGVLGGQGAISAQNAGRSNERQPFVSICITHFNRPELLSDCLASVRAQTYQNFEVVLVDDGSTQPAARAYLDTLKAEFDARGWILIRQDNRYLGAARNAAAKAASGDYLFILDDDNLLMPEGIARAVQVAERTQADVVTAVMALFSGPAGFAPHWPDRLWPHSGNCPLLGVLENNLGDANALVRRSSLLALGGYSEDRGIGAEDWELYAKAILQGLRLEHSLMPFSWYRVDANSMSRAGYWWRDYRRALRSYEEVLPVELVELPALAGELKRKVGALEPFQAEALSSRRAVMQLQQALAQTQQELVRTQQELAQTQQERYALYTSNSWKVTAPMRFLSRRWANLRQGAAASVGLNAGRALRGEIRRHGFGGVMRRVPYYLRRRDFLFSLLKRQNGLDAESWSFESVSTVSRPHRLHPDLTGNVSSIDRTVSVVIPTLNAGPEFSGLLRKLRSQQGVAAVEVVIVDSGSKDNSVEVAKQSGCTVVEIAPENFSHSWARNLGADHAKGDYLLFMVQDAYPIGDHWIYGMLRYLLDHAEEDVVAVSCSETPRSDSDMMYDSMIDTHYRFLACRDQDRIGRLQGTDHMTLRSQGQLSDVACLIPRDVFNQYRYRGDYAEDLDLGMRIIRDGKAVAMLASVKVIHSHNRPAFYYLKRSFVDVVFLVGLFDDFPRPRVQSVAGLIEGIDRVARHLSNWLLKQATMQGDQSSVKAVLDSWISDWRSRLINVPVVAHDVALNDSRLEASLLALKQRVLQTGGAGGVAADVQQFVDLFLGRLEHFAQYAMSVHEAMDARLCAEMQDAVIKIFAASAGSAMGFAYVQFKDGQDNESSLVRAIFAEWKAGI